MLPVNFSPETVLVLAISGILSFRVSKITMRIHKIRMQNGVINCLICMFSIETPLNMTTVTKKGADVVPIEFIPVVMFRRCTGCVPGKSYEATYGFTTT